MKEVLLWVTWYQTALHATAKLSMKGRVNDVEKFIVVLFLEITTAAPTFSNHHSDQSAAINIKVRPSTSKMVMIH